MQSYQIIPNTLHDHIFKLYLKFSKFLKIHMKISFDKETKMPMISIRTKGNEKGDELRFLDKYLSKCKLICFEYTNICLRISIIFHKYL